MKIGIITLHRVLNYGSALQAFALQKYIELTYGYDVELIDYIYPNKDHKKYLKEPFFKSIKSFFRRQIKENILEKRIWQVRSFDRFYHEFYKMSIKSYSSIAEIEEKRPQYDLYITGSDQLWNVKTLHDDPVYYCSFAPLDKPKIAFGASFTIRALPEEYKQCIRERLNSYSFIGVREMSGLNILDDLQLNSTIEKVNTCDPTLLLNSKEYDKLAVKSNITIDGDFILVYKLEYAFNAEPALSDCIKTARDYFGCKVVMIGNIMTRIENKDVRVSGIGPCEFIWLFKHAKAIVTSSFHGTMFSIIYSKPFVSICPPYSHEDRRITEVLERIGLKHCIFYNDNSAVKYDWCKAENIHNNELLNKYIQESMDFLHRAINSGIVEINNRNSC